MIGPFYSVRVRSTAEGRLLFGFRCFGSDVGGQRSSGLFNVFLMLCV